MTRISLGSICCVAMLSVSLALAASPGRGAALYEARCAFCHGPAGKGDGPVSRGLHPGAADFTAPENQDLSHSAIRNAIRNGVRNAPMLAAGDRIKRDDLEALVIFVEQLQQGGHLCP